MSTQPQRVGILPAILVTLAAFFSGVAFGVYMPIIPLHAASLGAPEWVVTAVVMALPSILALVVMMPAAIYADKTGRRKEILLLALALAFVFNILLGFARTWQELAVYRTISGVVFGLMSVFMAIGALISPPERRGTILAILGGSSMLGMGVSSLFAASLAAALGGYQGVYFFAAIMALIAIVFLALVKVPRVQLPAMRLSDVGATLKIRGVCWTGISIFTYLCGWNLMYPSLSIVVTSIYKAPPEIASIAMGVATIMLGAGTYIWGPVIDKWGGRRTLIFAILASAITTFIMYPAIGSLWAYVVLFWIVTLFGVVGAPGTSYVASRSVRPEVVTIAITGVWIFVMLASIVGGFLAGPLIASIGLANTILVAAVIELIGGIMMFGLPKV